MGADCEHNGRPIVNRGVWLVKNDTDQRLWIKPVGYDLSPRELAAGEEMVLTSHNFPIQSMPDFGSMRRHWELWPSENIYIALLSTTGTLLREWNYSDVMPAPAPKGNGDAAARAGEGVEAGHFFVEQSWTRTQTAGRRADEIDVTWVFTIKPHHIAPPAAADAGTGVAAGDGKGVRP